MPDPQTTANVMADLGGSTTPRSAMRFRTGKFVNVPVENVPTEYLREVLTGGGEVHLVTIELSEQERAAILDEITRRATGGTIPVELVAPAPVAAPVVSPIAPGLPASVGTEPVPGEPRIVTEPATDHAAALTAGAPVPGTGGGFAVPPPPPPPANETPAQKKKRLADEKKAAKLAGQK